MPIFEYTVDYDSYSTEANEMTLAEILKKAEIDPAKVYLIQLIGQ